MTGLPGIGEDPGERTALRRAVRLHETLHGGTPDRATLIGYATRLRAGTPLTGLMDGPNAAAALARIEQDPSVARVRLLPILFPGGTSPGHGIHYRWWLEENEALDDGARAALRTQVDGLPARPRLSFLVLGGDPALVSTTLQSLSGQLYPDIEIVVVANPVPASLPAGARAVAATGPRADRFNAGLQAATGDFVALVEAGDALSETAGFVAAHAIAHQPDLRLLYSDEDSIHPDGRRHRPVLKTDWDPDAMLAQDQVGRLMLISRALAVELGGMRAAAGDWAEYDLVLRASARIAPHQIRHLVAILYHRRTPPRAPWWSRLFAAPTPTPAGNRAALVREHLDTLGIAGAQVVGSGADPLRVAYPLPTDLPVVSIIVPTKDRLDLLRPCLEGLLHNTDYPALDIIVIDNDSRERATQAYFAGLNDPRLRVIPDPGPFNWAAINNRAVGFARGDLLVLLNNDIEIIEAGWLREMVAHMLRPEVGVVGAKLLFPDGRIQHAGIAVGPDHGPTAHCWMHAGGREPGYLNCLSIVHNASAVTGACFGLRKSVFRELGGFDAENLAVAGNDPDLCLRARARGYRVVWTPHACLIHAESATRGRDDGAKAARFAREQAHLRATWGAALERDCFLNPNISRFAAEPLIVPRSPVAPQWHGA